MKLFPYFLIFLSLLTLSCGRENAANGNSAPHITKQDIEDLNIQVENDHIVITGKTLSIDQFDLQGLRKKLHLNKSYKNVSFHCENFVIQTLLHMPGANVTIKAKNFKSYRGAQINLTPAPYETDAKKFQNGEKGEDGKTLTLNVDQADFHAVIDRPLFVVNGGNGQNAGAGENGRDGRSVDHSNGIIATYKMIDGEPVLVSGNGLPPTAGSDAKKGGLPGEPGNGGVIKTNIVLEPILYRIEGGTPGRPHETVFPGRPGGPNPYAEINEYNKKIYFHLESGQEEHGVAAKKQQGEYGEIIYLDELER